MNNDSYQLVIKNGPASNETIKALLSSMQPGGSSEQQSNATRHSFQVRFFHRPVLCMHCRDYVWGEGHVGYACVRCVRAVHASCKVFVNSHTEACPGVPSNGAATSIDQITRPTWCTVDSWSSTQVKEWLAVVNLHRYAEVFVTYNIDGGKLLNLDMYQLCAFRIRDSYHHTAILEARDELIYLARHFATLNQMILEEERIKGKL
jgi:hypothetical protein